MDIVLLGINGVVGAGIFLYPGEIARYVGPMAWLAYLTCALMCFCIALCFAEMASMYQSAGGAYLYAKDAFGPFVGYLVGWTVWLNAVLGWAVVSTGLLAVDTPWKPLYQAGFGKAAALLIVVGGLGFLNLKGARMGVMANNLFSLAKMLPLGFFLIFGCFHTTISPFVEHRTPDTGLSPFTLSQFANALLLVTFLFSGFEEIPVPAGEVRDPQRRVPQALFIVMVCATLLYLSAHLIAQGTLADLSTQQSPLTAAASRMMGGFGANLMAAAGIISLIGVNASIAFTGPRSMFVLAVDGYLPQKFAQVHPIWQTPWAAVTATTGFVLLLPLIDSLSAATAGVFHGFRMDVNTLAKLSALATIVQYLPTCIAVLIQRRRNPQRERPFKVPGGAIVPAIALLTCGFLIVEAQPSDQICTLVGILLGIPLYALSRRKPAVDFSS